MIEDCPGTNTEFDVLGLTIDPKNRNAKCYCLRATLDELLSDEVMVPVLRSAGYEPDEFREMMAEMARRNLVRLASQPDPLVAEGAPDSRHPTSHSCVAPTVSAILAPRLPSGFGWPAVLSRTV